MEIQRARSHSGSVQQDVLGSLSNDSYCSGKEAAGYTDMAAVGRSTLTHYSSIEPTPAPQPYRAQEKGASIAVRTTPDHGTSLTSSLAIPGALPESEQYIYMQNGSDRCSSIQEEQGSLSGVAKAYGKGVSYCSPIKFLWLSLLLAALLLAFVALVCAISLKASCDSDLEQMQSQLDMAVNQIEKLQQELLKLSNATEGQLSPTGLQKVLSEGGITFGATLMGIALYANCTTELVTSCSIEAESNPSTPQFCETAPMQLDMEGQYITNVYCARSDSDNEINPTVTTLHNPGTGTVSCLCYVVVPNEDYPQTNQVECGLYFTQCPILQNIDTTLQT